MSDFRSVFAGSWTLSVAWETMWDMKPLSVEVTRSELVESVHRVSVAVVDERGNLLASSGDAHLVTFWRSAAKPFQALSIRKPGAGARLRLALI